MRALGISKKGIRVSFFVKLAAAFFVLATVVVAITLTIFYQQARQLAIGEFRDKATSLAKTISTTINGDEIGQLRTAQDENTDLYRNLQAKLISFHKANTDARCVHILRKSSDPKELEFVVDGDFNPKTQGHLGQRLDISNLKKISEAFSKPTAGEELKAIKNGGILSGYAPVFDSTGKVVAIVGVDLSGAALEKKLLALRQSLFFWYIFPSIFIVIFVSWVLARQITRPIQSLALAASKIAEGDFNQHLEIETKDEIGELSNTFNQMTSSLIKEANHLDKKILELSTLNRIGQQVASTLQLNEVLRRIVDAAIDTLNAEIGSLVLVENMEEVVVRHRDKRVTFAPELDRAFKELASQLSQKAAVKKRAVVGLSKELKNKASPQAAVIVRDLLAAPVISRKHVTAVVAVYNKLDGKFDQDDWELLETLAANAAVAIENGHLYEQIRRNFLATISALAEAVDAKDPYTRGHSDRVTKYAICLAEEMGLDPNQIEAIQISSILHDIGKIGVSEKILLKPAKLTEKEYALVKEHSTIGAKILEPVKFPWPVIPLVLHHHERYNGRGYPQGLKDKEIPLGARILAVVDAYDAMMTDRPYRRALSRVETVAELVKNSGTQFDPKLVEAFLKIINTKIAAIEVQTPREKISRLKLSA